MDAYCASLKSTTRLPRENEFWGRKIRERLNSNVLVNQSAKSLKLERNGRKIKPGVAFSVLTRETGKETLVSLIIFGSRF